MSTQRLAEFLAAVSGFRDESAAIQGAAGGGPAPWSCPASVPATRLFRAVRRSPAGGGVGGRAVVQDLLVVTHDYGQAPHALPELTARSLQAAMAAPVHENGGVVGSLAIGSYDPGRTFGRQRAGGPAGLRRARPPGLTDARFGGD